MGAGLRLWWQKIQQHRRVIVIVAIVLAVAVATAIGMLLFGWDWIGLNGGYSKVTITQTPQGITRSTEKAPGKTLWDLIQLLIIPLALAIAGLLYNLARDRTDRRIAYDDRQEAMLQEYIDKMLELLLDKDLNAKPEAKYAARMRTLAVLSRLDTVRKRRLLLFLYGSGFNNTNIGKSVLDLSGANLSQISLSGANLNRIVLKGANLSGANLGTANLSSADLSLTNLSTAQLNRANLSGANLSAAQLNGANLGSANLSGTNLSAAQLNGANLGSANLSGTNLSGADLSGAKLSKLSLSQVEPGAKLSGHDLSGANLSGYDLEYADLSRANLSGANLSKANLRHANLREAHLSNTDLSGANLSGADLSGADLREADLRSASLRDADSWEATLRGAALRAALRAGRLREANLSGANLSGANLSGTNLTEANLSGANLSGTDLTRADLSGVDLSGADLSNTNLENALSLEDADLRRVSGLTTKQLEHCKARGTIIDEDPTTNSPQSTVSPPPARATRAEIERKLNEIQDEVIANAHDPTLREQVITKLLPGLSHMIQQSDDFPDIDPLELEPLIADHVRNLGLEPHPTKRSLLYFEEKLPSPQPSPDSEYSGIRSFAESKTPQET